ncbi:hypothetical protein LEMLEM_LOCUS13989 [Lemmus lemmus]
MRSGALFWPADHLALRNGTSILTNQNPLLEHSLRVPLWVWSLSWN